MPLFVPYLLMRSHLFTFYVGCVLNVLGTQMHHCGSVSYTHLTLPTILLV